MMDTVWAVGSKTFNALFATKELAENWMVVNGLNTPSSYIIPVEVPVIGLEKNRLPSPSGLTQSDGHLSIAHGFQAFLPAVKQPGWFKGEIVYHVDDNGRVDSIDEMKITATDELSPPVCRDLLSSQEALGEPFSTILHDNLSELYEYDKPTT
jgi:hypothetical protein